VKRDADARTILAGRLATHSSPPARYDSNTNQLANGLRCIRSTENDTFPAIGWAGPTLSFELPTRFSTRLNSSPSGGPFSLGCKRTPEWTSPLCVGNPSPWPPQGAELPRLNPVCFALIAFAVLADIIASFDRSPKYQSGLPKFGGMTFTKSVFESEKPLSLARTSKCSSDQNCAESAKREDSVSSIPLIDDLDRTTPHPNAPILSRSSAALFQDDREFAPLDTNGHLYRPDELPEILRLTADQVSVLEATGQITAIFVCGEKRFTSRQIDEFINSYLRVAQRKHGLEK
jgi:hypothetical protein